MNNYLKYGEIKLPLDFIENPKVNVKDLLSKKQEIELSIEDFHSFNFDGYFYKQALEDIEQIENEITDMYGKVYMNKYDICVCISKEEALKQSIQSLEDVFYKQVSEVYALTAVGNYFIKKTHLNLIQSSEDLYFNDQCGSFELINFKDIEEKNNLEEIIRKIKEV